MNVEEQVQKAISEGLKMQLTASLSPQQLESLIVEHCSRHGYAVKKIRANVQNVSEGYGPMETNTAKFIGYELELEKKDA